ncbi:MAG: imidazoleglycerol-phosphate dehydratase HisB [Dehalococcoidia bacterium]
MRQRRASQTRKTGETRVSVYLGLDGTGTYDIRTGSGVLDHLLAQLARHGLIDIKLRATGDLETGWHHLVEDVAITLGRTLRKALGDGTGIRRMGHALVPLDEALAMVVVDLGGRGYAAIGASLAEDQVEELSGELLRHFLESFAVEARITLHARLLSGENPHHRAEALFKALARALRQAVEPDPRAQGQVPSTKGTLG